MTDHVVLVTEGVSVLDAPIVDGKDIAGNPVDPTFLEAIFSSSSLEMRSIFTDKGPISKPPLVLDSGATATLDTFDEATLPGVYLSSADIGRKLTLTGSAQNDGDFRIVSILSTNRVRLRASFTLPDANDGSIGWELIDTRNGQLADDPSDVVVRINSVVVTVEAVIGLLGQIVLFTEPLPADDVRIDYTWCSNPRVDVRRLNSKEFRFNSWDRNDGSISTHSYRYNNVLIDPDHYDPLYGRVTLEKPLLRQLKYRAYERAYTALLNDPDRLLFNTPIHKVAYPKSSRPLQDTSVFYEGLTLPENDPTNPWVRKGFGAAVATAGTLVVTDNVTGTFPAGQPLFWTRQIDLTFDHVFSAAWRFSLDAVTVPEGVWTGIAAGYSDERLALVVGYLDDAGVKKIGFLKRGAQDRVTDIEAWGGGLDVDGNPTGEPVEFNWSLRHSYRLFTNQFGVVRLYTDGNVVESLRFIADNLPFLEELNAPFDEIQGAFFGSLSRPAENITSWDFYRYLAQPLNTLQISPAIFVSYEANVLPEVDPAPWTPIGYHGHSDIIGGDYLDIHSTSATDAATSAVVGLMGGDFRGYTKIEPLLTAASQFTVDFFVQLLTHTHSVEPNGLMVAVDDGRRLMQLSFLSDVGAPKLSYGGRSFPGDFSPYVWSSLGTQTSEMVGRVLRITDTSTTDGLIYTIEDTEPTIASSRVTSAGIDYMFEAQLRVVSYTLDAGGFAGATIDNFDSTRTLGLMLLEIAGTRYVAFHSDGASLGPTARFAFEWDDGDYHTYRVRKSTMGNLVSVFVDGTLLGTLPYSSFSAPGADPIGVLSFGSSTAASSGALSVIDWAYCNAWRILDTQRTYVGLWKGTAHGDFRDYHLPIKASGSGSATGSTLEDSIADFGVANVQIGDLVVVDEGSNQGVYEVTSVTTDTLGTSPPWPFQPTVVPYRVLREIDWTTASKYRLFRDSYGTVSVFYDTEVVPVITADYSSIALPVSGAGLVKVLTSGLPAIVFGSFSPEHLAQSRWDYVRYGITRSVTELGIVPLNRVLNQWNVMESPERLTTVVPHTRTSFRSSSTGITPQTVVDFLDNTSVPAYTQLNEGTPLVPLTQSFEVRGPYTTTEYVSAFNRPEDVLNNDGDFTLNDGSTRFRLVVPDDVLYSSLKVTEARDGELDLLRPFDDECGWSFGPLEYVKEVCLEYEAAALPEDTVSPTPWVRNSDDPGEVTASVLGGILTYGTSGVGTRTVYLNNTPLPDAVSLQTETSFRLRLVNDGTLGIGDSQVRFGVSAPGMTLGLGFVTTVIGTRFVLAFDLNSGAILGSSTYDYLDGNYHTYRIVRKPGSQKVEIFIDA